MHPGARSLAERNGLDELMGAGGKSLQQAVRALRLFGGAPDHAAHQEELRIMAAMPFSVDRFQVKPSPNAVKAGLDQLPAAAAIRGPSGRGPARHCFCTPSCQ